MSCLYENKRNNKCNALNDKNCLKCSFYKENNKENYKKFIVQAEKDILIYRKYHGGY